MTATDCLCHWAFADNRLCYFWYVWQLTASLITVHAFASEGGMCNIRMKPGSHYEQWRRQGQLTGLKVPWLRLNTLCHLLHCLWVPQFGNHPDRCSRRRCVGVFSTCDLPTSCPEAFIEWACLSLSGDEKMSVAHRSMSGTILPLEH